MSSGGETLPPVRVSDAERDRALRMLRDAIADGRLSTDTFAWRVDQALRSRNRRELADLIRDLPSRSYLADAAVRSAASMSGFISRVRVAWRTPRKERLRLPADPTHLYLLGRERHCDLVLREPTVSRNHALLHHGHGGWVLTDLRSTNGTRINGWRLTKPEPLRPGDLVSFGSQTVLITR